MYLYTVSLVYWQLLLYGVHVGHSFVNSIIFSAWLVYTYRQNILIINLFKTVLLFKNGYVGLNAACHFSGPIWFINLHRAVELFVNYSAKQCGEFCYTTYWIHGLISNWITLANTFKKLNRMVKNSNKGQFAKLELDSSPLVLGRFSWPRASFISSVHTSPHPTKESLYLGIPCLGIVDTNVSGHIANIAIPGNDDSLDCIVFYNTHVSQYILEKKYANVSGWFFNIRKNLRTIKFFDWVFARYINENGSINEFEVFEEERKRKESEDQLKNDLKYKVSYNNLWTYGLDLFFSRNYGLDNYKEQVDLYEPEESLVEFDVEYFLTEHRYLSLYLSKIVNYYIIKASWRFNRFVRKNTLKHKLFRRRFLVGVYEKVRLWKVTDSKNYMKARFYVNRIFKTHLRKNRYRANKFILKFLKFYFIRKYMVSRGFLPLYTSNLMQVSSLAYISISYGSRLFKNDIYVPLVKYGNFFVNKHKILKKDVLYKWSFFKKGIKESLLSVLNNSFVNKYYKISLKWNIYNILKKFFRKKLFSFFMSYKSFFNFFIWNRTVFFTKRFEQYKHSFKIWKVIKGMQRNYDYLSFLKEANFSLNSFLYLFYRNPSFGKFLNNKFISRPYLGYFFKTAIDNYTKGFFLNVRPYVYNKLFRFVSLFRKFLKKNKKVRARIFKVITKYSKPRYKYIKHSKNYKGKKRLRRVRLAGKKINFNTRFFRTLHYKKNKILPFLIRKGVDVDPKTKFVKLYSFIKDLPITNRRLHRARFLLKSVKNSVFLKFNQNSNKYNLSFSKDNRKYNFLKNLSKKALTLNFHDFFFFNYTKSVYRFNSLVSRYSNSYFFRWNELREYDFDRIKLLKKQRKLIDILEETKGRNLTLFKNRIDSELGYMYLHRKSYRIYKKALRSLAGISHYFLLGNNILNISFSDKFWLYSKKNFYFPSFFYLDFKLQKFRIFKPLYKSYMYKKSFRANKNKVLHYYYFPNFFRIFSLYNKYFYSYYKSDFPFYQKLLVRYNKIHKKVFWT